MAEEGRRLKELNERMLAGKVHDYTGADREEKPVAPPKPELNLGDVWKTLSLDDIPKFYQMPCARTSLLSGITASFVLFGLQLSLRRPIGKACNWAVGGFAGTTIVIWEGCRFQRVQRIGDMKRIVMENNRLQVRRTEVPEDGIQGVTREEWKREQEMLAKVEGGLPAGLGEKPV